MSLNKPGRLNNVTQLLGARKLKDRNTGEAIKVHRVNIPRDYIKISVEKDIMLPSLFFINIELKIPDRM